jgi:hypothetical protein
MVHGEPGVMFDASAMPALYPTAGYSSHCENSWKEHAHALGLLSVTEEATPEKLIVPPDGNADTSTSSLVVQMWFGCPAGVTKLIDAVVYVGLLGVRTTS